MLPWAASADMRKRHMAQAGKDNVYEITFLKTIMLCMHYVLFRVRQLYRAILEL